MAVQIKTNTIKVDGTSVGANVVFDDDLIDSLVYRIVDKGVLGVNGFKDTNIPINNLKLGNGLVIDNITKVGSTNSGQLDVKNLTITDVVDMYNNNTDKDSYLFVDAPALKKFQELVKENINSSISAIASFQYIKVNELPSSPQEGVIYMISSGTTANAYDLYAYVTDTDGTKKLMKIGQTATDAATLIAEVEAAADSAKSSLEEALNSIRTEESVINGIASEINDKYDAFKALVEEAETLKALMQAAVDTKAYLEEHLEEAKSAAEKLGDIIEYYNNIVKEVNAFETLYNNDLNEFKNLYTTYINNFTTKYNTAMTELGNGEATVKADVDRAETAANEAEEIKDEILEMSPFTYKGSVPTYDDLPTDAHSGQYYTTADTGDKWLWDGEQWIKTDRQLTALENLVNTKANSVDVYTKSEINTRTVEVINQSSTNDQWPTAKAVYNAIESKTNSYVITIADNAAFNSTEDTITASSIVDINDTPISLSNLKVGAMVYVKDVGVPDRWVSAKSSTVATFSKIESIGIDDDATTSTTVGWSANKLNTIIGDLESLLEALR